MRTVIKDKKDGFEKLFKAIKKDNNSYTLVGYQRGQEEVKPYKDDKQVHVVDVAIANEFGTDRIPSRSFVRRGPPVALVNILTYPSEGTSLWVICCAIDGPVGTVYLIILLLSSG